MANLRSKCLGKHEPKENSAVAKDQKKSVVVKQMSNAAALSIQQNRSAALALPEAGDKGWLLKETLAPCCIPSDSGLPPGLDEGHAEGRGAGAEQLGTSASSPPSPGASNSTSESAWGLL